MNSISWMIYAADVANSISNVLSLTSIGAALTAGGSLLVYAMTDEQPHAYSWENQETKASSAKTTRSGCLKIAKIAPLVFLGTALTASVIPSEDTIYAIAASESVEAVAKTETAQKAVTALNAWLDKQISAQAVSK